MRKWGRLWTKRALAIALALVLVLSQEAPVIAAEINELQDSGYETVIEDATEDTLEGTVEEGLTEGGELTDENPGGGVEEPFDGLEGESIESEAAEAGDDVQLAEEPEEEPIDPEELADLFPGVTIEDFLEDAEIQADKEELRENLDGFKNAVQGVDYTDDGIFVAAADEETAQMYAEAYGGTLIDIYFDYAYIELNADPAAPIRTAEEAVLASAEPDSMLPAAWPNLYGSLDSDETEIEYTEGNDYVGEGNYTNVTSNQYNDPYLKLSSAYSEYQYQHYKMNTEVAWDAGYTGSGVKVAVLDTGVYANHEDLGNVTAARTANFDYSSKKTVNGTNVDDDGHGTHCSGIIGANANNGKGGAGIAPGVTLYGYDMFNGGSFSLNAFAAAMKWAISQKVDVISLSVHIGDQFEANDYDRRIPVVENAVNEAYNKGIAVICAAGNFGGNTISYPGKCPNAVSVGAVDQYNARASFSNLNTKVRYSAPGVEIWSTNNDGKYINMSGTSQATPCVAGAYAITLQYARANGIVTDKNSRSVDRVLSMMDKGCDKTGVGKGTPNLARILGLKTKMQAPNAPKLGAGSIAPGVYNGASATITLTSDPNTTLWYNTNGKKISFKNGVVTNADRAESLPLTITLSGGTTAIRAMSVRNENMLCSSVASFNYTLRPPVTGVDVTVPGDVLKLQKGSKMALAASVSPASTVNKNVIWSIVGLTPTGVSLSSKGVLSATALAPDTSVTVRATSAADSSKYGSKTIQIVSNANSVASIKPMARSVSVYSGMTGTVDLTTMLKDRSIVTTSSYVKCVSTNSGIATATISGNRLTVKGISAGKCSIDILATDGSGAKATVPVVVNQKVTEIDVVIPAPRLVQGKSEKFTATVSPSNAYNKKVKWEVISTPLGGAGMMTDCAASLDAKGTFKVSALTPPGTYTFRVSSLDLSPYSKTFSVDVVAYGKAATGLTVTASSDRIFRDTNGYGAPVSCTVYATTSGGDSSTNDYLTVTSSNPTIATVSKSSTGRYTVKATGSATGTVVITAITADGTNIKKTIKITVANPPTGLLLGLPKGRSDVLGYGRKLQLQPTFLTESGAIDKTSKKLKWSVYAYDGVSSAGNKASITQAGVLTANLAYWRASGIKEAEEIASVVVKATAMDGSGVSATYTIRLNPEILALSCMGGDPFSVYPLLSYRSSGSSYWPSYTHAAVGPVAPVITINGSTVAVHPIKVGQHSVTITMNDGSNAKGKWSRWLYF